METLTFKTIIAAPREKVWNTMLEKSTYQEWTTPFQEGSTFDGTWEKGSEIQFFSTQQDGGIYALIAESRPYEFISLKHLGEIKNGQKSPWPHTGTGEMFENYTFNKVDDGANTEVVIDLSIPADWKEMFSRTWPLALAKLKEICER